MTPEELLKEAERILGIQYGMRPKWLWPKRWKTWMNLLDEWKMSEVDKMLENMRRELAP